MPAPTDTRVPHVIDVPAMTPTRRAPEGWLRGLVGGVEAAVLSWLTLVVPAIAAYVATAAAPALGNADWQTAARTGTSLWLLAHGGSVTVGGGEVSLPPLGLTLVSTALVYGASRRMRLDTSGAGAFAVVGFLLAMLLASLVSGSGADAGALAGGAGLAVLGVALGVRRNGASLPGWWARRWTRVPTWVAGGVRGAAWSLAGLAGLAVVALAVGAVVGWDRVRLVQDAYVLDPVSMTVMTLAQLLYLPTLAVWALSWVAGPGFAVGTGTLFAPGEVLAAPLPAIPVLGALPSPEAPGPQWVVLAPAVVGVVVGVLLHRRLPQESLARAAGTAVVSALGAALVTALLVLAAAGSIGPGRMAEVGADPAVVAGMVLAELGTGLLLTVLALHPRTVELLGAGARGARERVAAVADRHGARREDDEDAAPAPDSPDDGAAALGAKGSARTSADESGTAGRRATALVTPAGGRWHAVSSAAEATTTEDHGQTAPSPERPAAPDAPGRWSGPSLSDWTRPRD